MDHRRKSTCNVDEHLSETSVGGLKKGIYIYIVYTIWVYMTTDVRVHARVTPAGFSK
jgi:hypothetical protein